MAESLYRKYRPQIFEDVVGQEHIERTLKNAIEQDKVSHAYLFCGPRGTGKTTTARLLAKALLCQKGPTPDPDGTCEDCVMIANGEHPDVNEMDAASRTGVENVREEIIGRVQFAPVRGRYKVYIIDEVHMLSAAAFNALLKTLEEPPDHVVFILCTTDPQKVPETIHSRCQRFDFRRISTEALVSRLGAVCVAEGVEFEGEALDLIAHRADGGMRNALTSLEQVIAFSEGAVTLENTERLLGSLDASDYGEIMGAIGHRDVAACFRWTAEYVETGADLARFVQDLAVHVRNLYVMSVAGAEVALEVSSTERRELESELPLFAPDRLARMLGILGDLTNELKTSTNPRLSFEIALTRLVRPDSDLTLESLAERVEALESGYSAVAHVTSSAAPAPSAAGGVSAAPAGTTSAAVEAGAPTQGFASAGQTAGAAARSGSAAGMESRPAEDAAAREQAAAQARAAQEQAAAAAQADAAARERAAAEQARAAAEAQARAAAQAQAAAEAQAQAAAQAGAVVQPSTASAAAGAAGVSAQLAASLSNPASLQRVWQAALSTLKKEKAAYGVLFLNTKALFDAATGALSIEFPAENTFAFKAAQKPDVQTAVSSALQRACGEQLAFSYVQAGKRVAGGASAGAAAQTGAGAGSASTVQGGAGSAMAGRSSGSLKEAEQAAAQAIASTVAAARSSEPLSGAGRFSVQAGGAQASARQTFPATASGTSTARPEPATPAADPASAARRANPAPAYDYDPVPYDDVVPYDDADAMAYEDVPWEEPAPHAAAPRGQAAAGGAQAQTQPRPASGAPSTQPASDAAVRSAGATGAATSSQQSSGAAQGGSAVSASSGGLPPEPGARGGTSGGPAPDDLQAILAAGFGDGVSFEEVRE